MSEKRFEVIFNDSDFHLKDNETCDELRLFDEKVCYDYIADLLNELYDENIILKEELERISKSLDGISIPELWEFIDQYSKLNIPLTKIKNIFVDEEERLIGVEYK